MGSLPNEAKVVVIGGGIAGCSTAYHLADNGWNTVLIERDVLTSGTTWHAAGMVTQLGTTPQITKIRKNSVKFYNDLKKITGLDTSFKQTGTINIATTKSRHQEFLRQKITSMLTAAPGGALTPGGTFSTSSPPTCFFNTFKNN